MQFFPIERNFVVPYVLLSALSFYSKWLLSHSRIERAEIIFLRRHRAFRLIDYKRRVNIMKELTFRKGEEIKIGKEEDLKANWIQTSRKITTLFHSERQK